MIQKTIVGAILRICILFVLFFFSVGSPESCAASISNLFATILRDVSQNRTSEILALPQFKYSGKGVNDLGSYELCRSTPNTSYTALIVMTSTAPSILPITSLAIGLCGPANCTAQDYLNETVQQSLQMIVKITSPFLPFNISSMLSNLTIIPQDPSPYPPVTASSWVAFFIVGIPLLLALVASIKTAFDSEKLSRKTSLSDTYRSQSNDINKVDSDMYSLVKGDSDIQMKETSHNEEKISMASKIIDCWSIQENIKQIFSVGKNPKHDHNLDIFNGIRFLSILWVILGHVYLFGVSFMANISDLPLIISDSFLNVVVAGFFSVDVFFLLSGFFAAFVLYSKLKTMKVGIASYGLILLHRILRILPAYLFLVLLVWKISVYFGSGPVWGSYVGMASACDSNWWKNLLFIDVWYNSYNICVPWGWYLSNDMNMFLLSPIIVWLYLKKPMYGLSVIGLLLLGSLSIGLYYSFADDAKAGASYQQKPSWFTDIYVNPLVRVPPYLVGTALGLVYRSLKQGNKALQDLATKIKSSAINCWILELFGTGLVSLLVWLPKMVQTDTSVWPDWFHHIFMGLNRTLFAIGIAFIVLPTLSDSKTIITKILSARFWSPLATLTFSIYLIHLAIILGKRYSERSTFYLDDLNVIWEMMGIALVSLLGAMVIYLAIEAPIAKLESLSRGTQNKNQKVGIANSDQSQKSAYQKQSSLLNNEDTRVSGIQP